MKNLILLLTSLLLAGVANAGVAEFTTDAPQVDEWQDFQVSHLCEIISYIHVPDGLGRHINYGTYGKGGDDNRGHTMLATDDLGAHQVKCVKKSKVEECAKQNRIIDLSHKDAVCGNVCPPGKKPGNWSESWKCVPDGCPENTAWQSQHNKCVPVSELLTYCLSINKQYNHATRGCFTCPAGSFPQQSGCRTLSELNAYCASKNPAYVYGVAQNDCVSLFDMRDYCKTEFKKDYDPSVAECVSCPSGSYPQKSGCRTLAELNTYCASIDPHTVYAVVQDECRFLAEFRRFCKLRFGWDYNKDTAECVPCPADRPYPQMHDGCVGLDFIVAYCKSQGKAFDSANNACVTCSDTQVLRIHKDGSSSCGPNSIERCAAMDLAFISRTEECSTCSRDILVPYEGLCQASKQACNHHDRKFFAEMGCVDKCPINTTEQNGECVCRLKSGGECRSVDYLRNRCVRNGKVFNTTTGECSNS